MQKNEEISNCRNEVWIEVFIFFGGIMLLKVERFVDEFVLENGCILWHLKRDVTRRFQ
jgi:hypothetical protein